MDYRKELLKLKDEKNAEFVAKLTPGDFRILGARIPQLRDLAKRIAKEDWQNYLDNWSMEYFEDNMLRGLVIGYVKVDVDTRLQLYKDFIPYIDNWSVCDSTCSTWKPKKKEIRSLWDFIMKYSKNKSEFEMRFCASMIIFNFITDEYIDDVLKVLDGMKHEGYYLKMAVAWGVSMCFVKFPEKTMRYLKGKNSLDVWTYNKAIQKTIESYRVDDETKDELRRMKIRQ